MRSSDDAPVASDQPVADELPPAGEPPVASEPPAAGDEAGGPGAGQSQSPSRWRLWRPWLSLLAKPARRVVLLFVLALVIE